MSPVEAQAARRNPAPGSRPNTAQELYGNDYAKKFSRPATPPAPSPWDQPPAKAQAHEVSWGAEQETVDMNQPQAEQYEAPQGPALQQTAQPVFGPARPATPGSVPAHPESATKAVDSDIDDLLKKIGDVTKKK